MKKQLLLVVLMLSVAAGAFAVEAKIGGLWYDISTETNEAKVIMWKDSYNEYFGDIVIPETIEYEGVTCKVTRIDKSALDRKSVV